MGRSNVRPEGNGSDFATVGNNIGEQVMNFLDLLEATTLQGRRGASTR